MAGFGAAKKLQESDNKVDDTKLNEQDIRLNEVIERYASLRDELSSLVSNKLLTHLFVGVAGHENTGKTAIILDAFSSDKEAAERNEQLWVIDFDGGGSATASAFHSDNDRIRCWEPWVMLQGDRSAYDYPATHKRVMDIGHFAVDIARNQNKEDYDGPRIWGILVTGMDLWDSICINNMRIVDLNLAKDGIEAADWNVKVGHQWDWAIRKTRFHQLTAICRALVKSGVRVFWETHLRMTNYSYGNNEDTARWRPDWEKASNNYVFQILLCERNDFQNEEGEVTKSEYSVTFEKSKTNAALQGQKRTILVTELGKHPKWIGLPELTDGSL